MRAAQRRTAGPALRGPVPTARSGASARRVADTGQGLFAVGDGQVTDVLAGAEQPFQLLPERFFRDRDGLIWGHVGGGRQGRDGGHHGLVPQECCLAGLDQPINLFAGGRLQGVFLDQGLDVAGGDFQFVQFDGDGPAGSRPHDGHSAAQAGEPFAAAGGRGRGGAGGWGSGCGWPATAQNMAAKPARRRVRRRRTREGRSPKARRPRTVTMGLHPVSPEVGTIPIPRVRRVDGVYHSGRGEAAGAKNGVKGK